MADDSNDWPVHPAADLFPLLDGDELQALADDIASNGLVESLTLWDGPDGVVLLDGRNRLAACRLAGVKPRTKRYKGDDPVSFVVSSNIHRRHLTDGQRAMLALRVEPMYAEQARLRKAHGQTAPGKTLTANWPQASERAPQARDRAAKTTKTSGRSVARAKRIAESAPDLAEKVESGALALGAAEKQLKRRESQKKEQEARESTLLSVTVDAEGDGWRMLAGDFRDRLAELPDGCVDLIVTDPPYPEEFLPLWSDLGRHARRVLSDQGILVGLTGKIYLNQVIRSLDQHLNYAWCYVQPLPGANSRIMGRHVLQTWKPWLAYTRTTWPSGRIEWHPDTLDPSTRSKDQYRWAQGAEPAQYLISELCPDGGTVLDPFAGVGTYGVAAVELGRRFIGVELDSGRFGRAVEALNDV